jgi:hypothetical protein
MRNPQKPERKRDMKANSSRDEQKMLRCTAARSLLKFNPDGSRVGSFS